jgi:hypothetical protein
MATLNNQLVRVHRDVQAENLEIQANLARINNARFSILDVDNETALANQHRLLYPADPFDHLAAFGRYLMRQSLYNDLVLANQRIEELRQMPHRPLTLQQYLEACHSIHLAMPARDLLDPPSEVATHDDLQRWIYPKFIKPSTDFAAQQLGVWRQLAQSHALRTDTWYPSIFELEWTRNGVDRRIVSCKESTFEFMTTTVYEAVDTILDHIVQDDNLVEGLGLEGELKLLPAAI